jgi:hypothetical protein
MSDQPIAPELAYLEPRLSNRWWRLNNLYWIRDAHGHVIKFRANWAQRLFYASMWWLNVVLKVRQIGVSTFIGLMQLDRALFNKTQACGIIDRTDPDAVKKLKKIEFAYDNLDNPADPRTAALGQAIKQAVTKVKSNDHLLEFGNGSQIWCGVTLRGDTINFLHVSELGWIAHEDPPKAEEIAAGSFNTVHAGNVIVVEATHEGGRFGLFYELVRLAQACPELKFRTMLDWQFHFFAWVYEPSYQLPLAGPLNLTTDEVRYFDNLEHVTAVTLTSEQKHWWSKKSRMPKIDMARQYPGTVEEALTAQVAGAIYGKEFNALRAAGRVRDFVPDGSAGLFAFWDLGQSDYVAIHFVQFVGLDILWWDYHTAQGETVAQSIGACQERERMFGRPIRQHFVPHDAGSKNLEGRTYLQGMAECGVRNVTRVPITPDVWIGIKHLRTLIPRSYFHATNCEREVVLPRGRRLPSCLGALEGYHSKLEAVGGRVIEAPVHDQSSHGADAARTLAEADERGMLDDFRTTAVMTPARVVRVITGHGNTQVITARR